MDEQPSKKRKLRNSKKNLPITDTSDDGLDPLSSAEKANIEHVFAQALTKYKEELIDQAKQQSKDLSRLPVIIEEFLGCFILIGYTIEGNRVNIFNARSARDEAALVDHLRSTLISIANERA